MNEEVENIMNAIGSTAEMCSVFYKACKEQGFTDRQAMELTKQLPLAMLSPGSRGHHHEQ